MSKRTNAEMAAKLQGAAADARSAVELVRSINPWPLTPDTVLVYLARKEITQAADSLQFAWHVFEQEAEEDARRAEKERLHDEATAEADLAAGKTDPFDAEHDALDEPSELVRVEYGPG